MVSFKEFLKVKEELLNENINYQDCINQNACKEINDALANINSDAIQDKIRTLATNEKYKDAFKKFMVAHIICNKAKRKSAISDKDDNSLLNQALNKFNKGTISPEIKKYKDAIDNFLKKSDIDFDDNSSIDNFLNSFDVNDLASHVDEQNKFNDLINQIKNAKNQDELDKLNDSIEEFEEESLRNQLEKEVNNRSEELKNNTEEKSETQGQTPKPENTQETSKKSEIIGAGNVDYIAGSSLPVKELRNAIFDGDKKAADVALDKWQEMVTKKIAELNEAKNNKVEQDSKYLKEEQEVLWEGILQNIKDKRDLKYKKVNEFKNIYDRDESSDSAYEEKLKEIFDNARVKIGDICENINDYSISNRKREEYKSRATTIISHLIDSTYSLLRNLKKNNSKEGFFNKRKIENAKEKERENEEYEKSFRGKDLNKKASMLAQNFADTFVAAFKINQVKNIDDIAKRQILDLIAESDGNVQDFIRLVNKSRVMSPNDGEATMFAINWLNNKGLKVPGNISNSDIDLTERNPEIRGIKEAFELIKQKIGAEITPPYPDGIIANIVRRVESIAANNKDQTTKQNLINDLLTSKENKEYPNEVKIISDKFGVSLENKPQDEQNSKLTPEQEEQARKIEETGQQQQQNDGLTSASATVTTAKCDGLPIGARRYSRAIRRRMNYALNKYM